MSSQEPLAAQQTAADDASAYPYSADLEPTLVVGDSVLIQPTGISGQVEALDLQPGIVVTELVDDGGGTVVPANSSLRDVEIRSLYNNDRFLAQYRLPPDPVNDTSPIPTDVEITVAQGGEQQTRYENKNSVGQLRPQTPFYGSGSPFTELWQYSDSDLHFTVDNNAASSVDGDDLELIYIGWQYRLDLSVNVTADEASAVVTAGRIDQ
jgi:hypothetical protein